jgi:predicted DNA-binding protein YlxM (UPF0122 family)
MPLQRTSTGRRRTGLPRALDGRTAVVRLFDTYARLLTARQREMLRMYYHDDLSLGEIAARCGVTRQAVFDSLRRSVRELWSLEKRVGVVTGRARQTRVHETLRARLADVESEVARLAATGRADVTSLRGALRALRESL